MRNYDLLAEAGQLIAEMNTLDGQGKFADAIPLARKAREICTKVLGDQHPDTATSLNSLSFLLVEQGDCTAARLYYEQALAIRKKVLGEQHPDTALSLNNLGLLLKAQGDYVGARAYYEQAMAISLRSLDLAAAGKSERQQLAMAKNLRYQLNNFLALARDAKLPAEQAYAPVLAWKGAVFLRQRQRRLVRGQPELAELVKDLGSTSAKLAHLAFAVPDPKKHEAWQRQLDKLTRDREKLERELASRSREFREGQDLAKVTLADLRKVLPADAVLVDFLEYQHWTPPAKKGDKAKMGGAVDGLRNHCRCGPGAIGLGPSSADR